MSEPTIDLYAVLGLRQTDQPTHAQVRKAYRKLSKTAHPDVGGDPAVFARISLAHDVLTDEARRARYDATGEFDQGEADNAHVATYAPLALLLDEVAQEVIKQKRDIDTVDYVFEMRVTLRTRIKLIDTAIGKVKKDLPNLRRAQNRILKRGGDGPNVVASIFAGRVDKLEEFVKQLAKEQDDARKMLTFLDDYDFDLSDMMRQAAPERATLLLNNTGFIFTNST